VIDKDGVRPQPEKLDIIREWKPPQDEADLRRFLGVCTFWRRGIFLSSLQRFHWAKKKLGVIGTLKYSRNCALKLVT
jgi:hypothetical protein